MEQGKKTGGKRNRNAGHAWEREGVNDFGRFYPNVASSRAVSRARDAEKVDLAYPDEIKFGRFPFNAQYKSYSRPIPYPKLLSELPKIEGVINVIMHKQTERVGTRFMPKGKFAILGSDDFFKLVAYKVGFELLMTYFDSLDTDEQVIVNKRLLEIGL